MDALALTPIGHVRSPLADPARAPKQGDEGAPEARLIFGPGFAEGLRDLRAGEEILVLTWLHRARRDLLSVHPRDDAGAPLRGVFSTRSADRPNPVGIHRVTIAEVVSATELRVLGLEAVDETPVIDIKPVFDRARER
ncbi:MAG TPA: tRNA (N6-threonylcarbamoyladenosine(37)-N6)-methyltransferase TrmO [Longimicrobium sp.]|nr:tRNA (N6-threonylcarbamoyladenosine(37)-N6)-methyltransferase TrmO [Longimicrobium sp.]